MTRQIITRRIAGIRREAELLRRALDAMETTDLRTDAGTFNQLSTLAALRSELIACKMRHLLYAATDVRKEEYLPSAAQMQGIVIREYADMFEIELPCLFPKRDKHYGNEYLLDPLHYTLGRYMERRPIPKYTDCVVCFVHEYNHELPARRILDHDNLEQKQVLDVIASFLLVDDGGFCCDTYNMTMLGEADRTHIFVMSKPRFCIWLSEKCAV